MAFWPSADGSNKAATARALVALDCGYVAFFFAGTRFRQLEPVWGGTQDTAVDIRMTCTMGLAGTAYHRALPELVSLLADPEPQVRAGVISAIACCESIAGEAVLRTKALAGDPKPEVTGVWLLALLELKPAGVTAPFVGTFLDRGNSPHRELAALALGESRLLEGTVPVEIRLVTLTYWLESMVARRPGRSSQKPPTESTVR